MKTFLFLWCWFATAARISYGWTPISSTRTRTAQISRTELSAAAPSRRDLLATVASITAACIGAQKTTALESLENQQYSLKFPTLFAPLYGEASRKTIKRSLGNDIWALEQNLELGPLQTPIRCTVIRLKDGSLWVHAPLASTQEFLELVESCSIDGNVAHLVVPTYALEHKVFVKDCLQRWPDAQLWTSPGQFSFPFAVSEQITFGKAVTGVLIGNSINSNSSSNTNNSQSQTATTIPPPWSDEIEYATLEAGTFNIGGKPTTLCETAFFHKVSKSLIVTDAVAFIPKTVPPLNDPEQLLLISKRSTADPMPADTPESRLVGWEKTALLVSYFFPEHEELDPNNAGVVTWTEGWHDNFNALAGRLIVPPVVRTLIYAQNPARVKHWVDQITTYDSNSENKNGWDFEQIIPAHFEAPIATTPKDFARAFRFLEDDSIDAFPKNDMARGLKPIADVALKVL
jgi:hypothetical protein